MNTAGIEWSNYIARLNAVEVAKATAAELRVESGELRVGKEGK